MGVLLLLCSLGVCSLLLVALKCSVLVSLCVCAESCVLLCSCVHWLLLCFVVVYSCVILIVIRHHGDARSENHDAAYQPHFSVFAAKSQSVRVAVRKYRPAHRRTNHRIRRIHEPCARRGGGGVHEKGNEKTCWTHHAKR